MKEKEMYAHWLCSVPWIGSKTVIRLLESVGPPEEIYRQSERLADAPVAGLTQRQAESLLRQKRNVDPEESYVNLIKKNICFVWIGMEEYPARLRDIPDQPAALYYKGRLPAGQQIFVSVIGARDCSSYGRYMSEELGKKLAESGVVVVSGLARGIDGISQRAALEQGGISLGVMGCGVDICYPAQNRDIYEMLLQKGAVVSEYVPGTEPLPHLFPPRNRIISGLSDALVVVEARKRSGTLITVDMALEQGKDVYVVPGRVTDPLSVGCNELIRQGAGVITSADDFAAHVCKKPKPAKDWESVAGNQRNALGAMENMPALKRYILERLDAAPKTVDELYASVLQTVEVPLQPVLSALWELCAEGRAEQAGGSFILTFYP